MNIERDSSNDGGESKTTDEDTADYISTELDEIVWRQIKCNDPSIASVFMCGQTLDDYPYEIDWRNEGYCIGSNTHIKELYVFRWNAPTYEQISPEDQQDHSQFWRALSQNRSVEHLRIDHSRLFQGDWLSFFDNINLRRLQLSNCLDVAGHSNPSMVLSILKRCSSLQQVKLCHHNIEGIVGDQIFDNLSEQSLVKLSLDNCQIGDIVLVINHSATYFNPQHVHYRTLILNSAVSMMNELVYWE